MRNVILYEANEKEFISNGLCTLHDLTKCIVTENRNGTFYLEATLPIGSIHAPLIEKNRILYASSSENNEQPFRIAEIEKNMSEYQIYARHISDDLDGIPVKPFKAHDASSALRGLKENSMIEHNFTIWTDIVGQGTYDQKEPLTFKQCLGGVKGSILDSFGNGAEYEFDKFSIKLHAARGCDSNVTIRYGKNLTDLKQEESIDAVYTGILPYYYKEDNGNANLVSGDIVFIDNHVQFPKERVYILDCTDEFDELPNKIDLNNQAVKYIRANAIGIPKISLEVSFVNLWQTSEYADIANLERVNLCDTVHVIFEKLGIDAKAKVVKTEWDSLTERYVTITLGEAKTTFSKVIEASAKNAVEPTLKSFVDSAVANATTKIANQLNLSGYVTKITDASGNWSELVISDNPDYKKARNVWRWSQGGLGFSSNGYAGPYTTAITADGHINGAMITAGTINANTVNVGNKVLTETLTELADRHTAADGRMRELASRIEQNTDNIVLSVTRQEYEGYKAFMRAMLDENGLHVGGEGEETQTSINGRGVKVVDTNGKVLAQFDKLNNILAYLAVREFLSVGSHRLEAKLDEIEITEFANGNIKTGQVDCTYMYWIGDVD